MSRPVLGRSVIAIIIYCLIPEKALANGFLSLPLPRSLFLPLPSLHPRSSTLLSECFSPPPFFLPPSPYPHHLPPFSSLFSFSFNPTPFISFIFLRLLYIFRYLYISRYLYIAHLHYNHHFFTSTSLLLMLHDSMDNNPLTLFCLVDGDATSQAFPVTTSNTTTVGELKKLIKADNSATFKGVDAKNLTLWRVSVPVNTDNQHNPIGLDKIESRTELNPIVEVSGVFPKTPPKETIHVIVQRPLPARTSHSPPPLRILDIIKTIQGALHPLYQVLDSPPNLPTSMPWQEPRQSMQEAITSVAANVATYKGSRGNRVAKSTSSILVCSGAPGVGKC
ncbi:MAG: hypothetical protein J3R72DRAFT_28194 [Linnemannia gamsii]|nr:MAG: hypothetical protein J3R72DRAFT_28194 [Linnemannia gamsii]